MSKNILEKLKDDSNYYGDFGKQYLSNSDIINLLKDPSSFRKPKEQTKAMLEGRYFHTKILEPNKLDEFKVLDVSSRTTKAFKELDDDIKPNVLLSKEMQHLEFLTDKMTSNMTLFDLIYAEGNEYEVPGLATIMNEQWKGKADIINHNSFELDMGGEVRYFEDGAIIDIKTSSDIDKFLYSAKSYNYDSQAYIYQRMFNKPLFFIVIDKRNGRLKIADCSPAFIESGKEKVEKAIEVYHKFFSDEKTEDIDNYIFRETL